MKGKIQSVTESATTFTVVLTNETPPPAEHVILNPPEWSRPLFRAGIGKDADITENPPGSGTVGAVKVSA